MHSPTMPPTAAPRRVPARAAGPARRRAAGSQPPEGPFIDGRQDFDWTTARAFARAPETDETPVVPGLDAPRPLTPAERAVVDAAAIVLAWSATDGDHRYDVQLSPDPQFLATVLQLSTSGSTELSLAGLPIPAGARLYWRVRSARAGGVSEWCAPGHFYAGAPRDVDAHQARQAALEDARRRESARRLADSQASDDAVPLYLRETAVTTSLEATIAAAILAGMGLVFLLGVVLGALLS